MEARPRNRQDNLAVEGGQMNEELIDAVKSIRVRVALLVGLFMGDIINHSMTLHAILAELKAIRELQQPKP